MRQQRTFALCGASPKRGGYRANRHAELEKANIQRPTGTESAGYVAQAQLNTGVEAPIRESPL